MARFGLRAGLPATAAGAAVPHAAGPGAVRRHGGARLPPAEPSRHRLGRGCCSPRPGTGTAGRSPRAGRRPSPTALASLLESLGGTVVTGHPVRSRADLPPARLTLFDTGPRAVAEILGDELPGRARRAYRRWRPGPGAFKVDLAVRGGVPWTAEPARRAGTVHVGGTLEEIADGRGGGLRRPDARAAVRPGRPAVPGRPDPGRRRRAPGLGLRARADRVGRPRRGGGPRPARAVRAGAARPGGRPPRCGPRPTSRPTTPTTSAATSPPGPTTCASSWCGPAGADPYATGVPGVYLCSSSTPPGRRRARDVRLPRRHQRAGVAQTSELTASTAASTWSGLVAMLGPSRTYDVAYGVELPTTPGVAELEDRVRRPLAVARRSRRCRPTGRGRPAS